jgi:hypothetical protein
MSGRIDYEERRQDRIDRLNDASYKASKESDAAFKRSHDLVKDIPLGQPNINGALTSVQNRSRNAADKSLKLAEKSDYYADRAEAAEHNRAISSDDPAAIQKLQDKILRLEAEKDRIKAFNKEAKKNGTEPAPWYTLPYLGRDIKAAKERIAKLERIDQMPAEIIKFDGGEIISNAEINRVQIIFDERQNETVTQKLKSNGFNWSPSEKAWQKLRNYNALDAAKKICNI